MEVGLEHVGDLHAFGGGEVQDPVDVTLRVDDARHRAVMDQVAAVAQTRGLDGNDGWHHELFLSVGEVGYGAGPNINGMPARCQAVV